MIPNEESVKILSHKFESLEQEEYSFNSISSRLKSIIDSNLSELKTIREFLKDRKVENLTPTPSSGFPGIFTVMKIIVLTFVILSIIGFITLKLKESV